MTARTIVFLSLLAGIALGVGTTLLGFGFAGTRLGPDPEGLATPVDELIPRLVVDATEHDFGGIEAEAHVKHAFKFTNEGPGVLQLKSGTTSCSACTIATLSKSELAPGESTEIIVEYEAGRMSQDFVQTATVLTNDPRYSRVELTVIGTVKGKFLASPSSFQFGNVAAGQAATSQVGFYYLFQGEMRIEGHSFENADTARFFDLKVEPADPAQLAENDASSGGRLVLSLKPGLPLGAFTQTIRLALKVDGQSSERELIAAGTIVSDLSIVGPGWREDSGVLSLGTVRSDRGAKRSLRILVRGELRDQVQIVPGEVKPSGLLISVGERSALNENVSQIPLNIEIPPGLPPMVHLGTTQWPFGEIVLEVKDHPSVKELRLRLRFAIQ